MQFREPHHKCKQHLQHFFAKTGEKTHNDVNQRHQTSEFDEHAGYICMHERTHPRIARKFSFWSRQPTQTADISS